MKKLVSLGFFISSVLLFSFTLFASDISILIDGEKLDTPVPPIIENDRTLVPMRAIFESLGMTVEWDEATKEVTGKNDNTTIVLTINSKVATVNGIEKELDAAPKIVNDSTLVPLRFIAEAIDCDVSWDDAAREVRIISMKDNDSQDLYVEQNPAIITAAKGVNDFAFRLSAALAEEAGDKNFVCSPYSVWLPLAALVNATDEQNKAELLAALNAAGISEADINNAAYRMLYVLTKQYDKEFLEITGRGYYHDPLKIANAIFVGKNVTLKKDFAQIFADYYHGNAINVDFSSKDAVDAVNKWASDNTDGLITNIVDKFEPNTVAAIANAIYFSDRWNWEFNADNTKEDVFHSPTGETKAFFMRRKGDEQIYYEDDKVQAMPLEFKTGGGLYIILPKDGDAVGLLSSMTSEYFDEIRKDSIYATGTLLLPRFSIESDVMQLEGTLTALGVPLFNETTAPLTGGLIEENIPVWLSSAAQKAVIEVDEKGTTAAAVTVMIASGSAMPVPTEPFEMNCNKPFVFVLYDYTYDGGNQVLFTGIVNQP